MRPFSFTLNWIIFGSVIFANIQGSWNAVQLQLRENAATQGADEIIPSEPSRVGRTFNFFNRPPPPPPLPSQIYRPPFMEGPPQLPLQPLPPPRYASTYYPNENSLGPMSWIFMQEIGSFLVTFIMQLVMAAAAPQLQYPQRPIEYPYDYEDSRSPYLSVDDRSSMNIDFTNQNQG